MRLRNIKDTDLKFANCKAIIEDAAVYKGNWKETYFKNNNPIHVEFGMGKGQFLSTHAINNSDINYVGFEKFTKVLVRALDKFDELENAAIVRMDVEAIEDVFEEGEIDIIYLNFSDPWPKDRHGKRRLTYRTFLDRYRTILKDKGEVHFKTDNQDLFDFSIEEFQERGWNLRNVTRDLHHSEYIEGNIMTEYEERYVSIGQPIYRLIAMKPHTEMNMMDE
ncbi:tRNA (guanosine(46)-N7)-methyltransferase TrmB [Vallitalea okinawensis]|uniref:tRNA (guanosine(46)-N7)-methyltransferase TrmB n=1 Tax=Vallitalea okinawensis TaxID=2078660 RepID=UPI000CFC8815|nr:tRNA (guanosine(46)-N7)-methyltransferase TrmB [Vallitalea okinawensis]